MASGHRRAGGLTMIELLVVVGLVALIAALTAPSMMGLIASQRVRGINAELVTDIQFARSEAARRNVLVYFSIGGNGSLSCYVLYLTNPIFGDCDCTLAPGSVCGEAEVKRVQIPRSTQVSIVGSRRTVAFNPLAGLEVGDSLRIDVASSVNGQMRTSLNKTGRPSVCSPDGSISQAARCPD